MEKGLCALSAGRFFYLTSAVKSSHYETTDGQYGTTLCYYSNRASRDHLQVVLNQTLRMSSNGMFSTGTRLTRAQQKWPLQ